MMNRLISKGDILMREIFPSSLLHLRNPCEELNKRFLPAFLDTLVDEFGLDLLLGGDQKIVKLHVE